MTLVLTPKGRGRWSRITLTWDASRRRELPTTVEVRVGQDWTMGGVVYRVCEVWP